jgi:cyclopropane-fatty-acyl-phospholipid synthase
VKDYLHWHSENLIDACERLMSQKTESFKLDKIEFYTSPRLFGYTFNPVSFFFCYRGEEYIGMIADVNNTFSEKHVYVLPASDDKSAAHEKEFHVSPFFGSDGAYVFSTSKNHNEFKVNMKYLINEREVFQAMIHGQKKVGAKGWITLLRRGWSPWLTYLRILFQAGILYYRKAMNVISKPAPQHANTLRSAPHSCREKIGFRLFCKTLKKLKKSALDIELPDSRLIRLGDESAETAALLQVKDYRFFWHCAMAGDIGLGEAYEWGWWDSPNTIEVFHFFIANRYELPAPSFLRGFQQRIFHYLHRNTKTGSKKNIAAHYDLSNDFFKLWLDEEMMYSSAVYDENTASLDSAQKLKIQKIVKDLDLRDGMKVLEIGTGWGGLCTAIAKAANVHVTSLTLSQEQARYTKDRLKREHLSSRVDVLLKDYRDMSGQFDRIVSIEMLEAVGHENLRSYFEQCDRLLVDAGLIFIQVISIPDERYLEYRKSVDWIRRYIFPGGHLPSIGAISNAIEKTPLFIDRLSNISQSYARTLEDWKIAFNNKKVDILKLGFDESFQRRWNYYFDYCRAGFLTEMIQDYQIILKKSGIDHGNKN